MTLFRFFLNFYIYKKNKILIEYAEVYSIQSVVCLP